MAEREHESLTVYTMAWWDDAQIEDRSTQPLAHAHCRVFIDGREIICAFAAAIQARGGEFTTVSVELSPSSIKFVSCTREEWEALDAGRKPPPPEDPSHRST